MNLQTEERQDYWDEIAKRWGFIGSPLRPNDEDLRFFANVVERVERQGSAMRALILGVTQELYRLPWPDGTDLKAIDHTPAMIEALWPGSREDAVCGEWTDIPDALGDRDLVLCDGGFHLLSHPTGQERLVSRLAEVVSPGGRFVVRLFALPKAPEEPEAVLDDLLAGRVPSMNHLKMRLGMALQPSSKEGVAVRDVWQVLNSAAPDLEALADRLGWDRDHALAVNSYRESENRYFFVSEEQVIEMVCGGGDFRVEKMDYPTYELGDRCPTVSFVRQGGRPL